MEELFLVWYGVTVLCIYLLPTLAAFHRVHRHKLAIAAVNVFLGWTVLGWVAALVWAFVGGRPRVLPGPIQSRPQTEQPGGRTH